MYKAYAAMALASFAASAAAAPPSAESIENLLKATKTDQVPASVANSIEQGVRQGMAQLLAGKQLTEEQRRKAEAEPLRIMAKVREELSWAKVKPTYVQIYQEAFTQDDINAMLAFYRSPAGKAFIEKMPGVLQKSAAAMQSRVGPMLGEMRTAMQKSAAEADSKK